MNSIISICNKGLRYLGGTPISSLEEESLGAQLCSQFYPEIRDEVLESHHWSFAARYILLPRLPEAPPFGFAHAYQLPADCLRICSLEGGSAFEVVEGRKLYTDSAPAEAVVTVQVTDPMRFSAQFVEVVARKLAAELAVPLMNSTKLEKTMMQKYFAALDRAAALDGAEGVRQVQEEDGWLQARSL